MRVLCKCVCVCVLSKISPASKLKLLKNYDDGHQDAHEHEKVNAYDDPAGSLRVLGFDQLFPPFVYLHRSCGAVVFYGI